MESILHGLKLDKNSILMEKLNCRAKRGEERRQLNYYFDYFTEQR